MKDKGSFLNTISGQAYEIIKKDICEGTYPPGYWLQENELATRLSISRSPVREALRHLVADQLVVEVPNKGVFVRALSRRDIEEIFDVRVLLETYALDHIYENLTDSRRENLLDVLESLKKSYAANDLDAYKNCDMQLHDMIIHQANNILVESICKQISFLICRFRSYSLKDNKRFTESVLEHEQIVRHILSGQIEEAKSINCRHLKLARDNILVHIDNSQIDVSAENADGDK